MPTLAQKLQHVVNAYNWEQDQVSRWKGTMAHVPPDAKTGPAGPTFKSIWDSYFDYVTESNGVIIKYCQAALDSGDSKKIQEAIDKLSKHEHERTRVKAVESESEKHGASSDYLAQLNALMNLEVQVRDYLENYLV